MFRCLGHVSMNLYSYLKGNFIHTTLGTQVSTKAVIVDWLRALLPSWKIANLTTDWNDGRYKS